MSLELLFITMLVVLGIMLLVRAIMFRRVFSHSAAKPFVSGFCDFYERCPMDSKRELEAKDLSHREEG